jgi:hypothetical protein
MDDAPLQPLLQSGGSSNQLIYWMVCAMAVLFILYTTARPLFRKNRDPLTNQPFRMTLTQHKSLERDMQSLLVELHDMARQMTAQIETRAARLELLIQEADRQIARLAALEAPPGAAPEPAAAEPGRTPMRLVTDSADPNTQRHADIYRLADEGLDARQIAQRLARPAGEIELLLALRRQRPATEITPGGDISEPPTIASA